MRESPSGYRPGGPNLTISPGTPSQYSPDKTKNYEIGTKADFLGRSVVDRWLAVLHQLGRTFSSTWSMRKPVWVTTVMAVRAKSQGVELSAEAKPATGLTIATWVTFSDAELTEAFPAISSAYGVSGNSLPYSSRFSGNFSLRQEFPIVALLKGFAGGTLSYVGSREGEFTSSAARQDLPAFARTDLQAGVKYADWTLNFFINNLTDKRGVLAGGLGSLSAVRLLVHSASHRRVFRCQNVLAAVLDRTSVASAFHEASAFREARNSRRDSHSVCGYGLDGSPRLRRPTWTHRPTRSMSSR